MFLFKFIYRLKFLFKMYVIVFGSNGMLGKYVCKYLQLQGHTVQKLTRQEFNIYTECEKKTLESTLTFLIGSGKPDYVINCSGVINKRSDLTITEMYFVNAYFPIILANICVKYNIGLIHPTTDCVYSGDKGLYTKKDLPDCTTDYGVSKYLGEKLPFTTSTKLSVIRCSIIGEEYGSNRSLLSWVLGNKNKTIDGYTNQVWNGITCLEYAKLMNKIIEDKGWNGVYHVRSSFKNHKYLTKYDLVKIISDIYRLNITVNPAQAIESHNRSLEADVVLKDIEEQIREMRLFGIHLKSNIVHMPTAFKVVSGKDVVMISSTIHAKSAYSPQERFDQTLKTIESCRKQIPDCKVVLVEMSKICTEWILTLSELCDQLILCGEDSEFQMCNQLGKSMGETTLTKLFFQNISDDTEMVYKISGRYWMTEKFNPTDMVRDKFNFLPSDRCVHTTFYSVGKPHFKKLPDILASIQHFVIHPANDIEHGYWVFLNQDDINFVKKLNCQGYWSVNKTFYDM